MALPHHRMQFFLVGCRKQCLGGVEVPDCSYSRNKTQEHRWLSCGGSVAVDRACLELRYPQVPSELLRTGDNGTKGLFFTSPLIPVYPPEGGSGRWKDRNLKSLLLKMPSLQPLSISLGHCLFDIFFFFFFFPRRFPACKIAMEDHKKIFQCFKPLLELYNGKYYLYAKTWKGAALYNLRLLYCVCFVCVSGSQQ